MPKRRRILVISLIFLAVAAGARLYAHLTARAYGQQLGEALSVVSKSGFADTGSLRNYLAAPDMATRHIWVERLAFLGGGYGDLMEELKTGMLYCSEQIAVPVDQRFQQPPKLQRLRIPIHDRTDEGVVAAAVALILDYRESL